MSKFFLAIFFALLLLVTIGILVVLYFLRKGIKFFRRLSTGNISDEDFQRMADKYYSSNKRENVRFDDDYFKGTNRTGSRNNQQEQPRRRQQPTRTADGVIIVDNRDPNIANKKIFAHDEGEYVDYQE